jgi:hypothetical protein
LKLKNRAVAQVNACRIKVFITYLLVLEFSASCAVITVWEAFFIGIFGAFLANITDPLLIYFK